MKKMSGIRSRWRTHNVSLMVLLVLGCVCSSALPHWLWEKISKNTVAKLLVFALLTALCVCYVVAATNATALYANF